MKISFYKGRIEGGRGCEPVQAKSALHAAKVFALKWAKPIYTHPKVINVVSPRSPAPFKVTVADVVNGKRTAAAIVTVYVEKLK
jgi:hypothetical protein